MNLIAQKLILLAKALREEFQKTRDALHGDISRVADDVENLKDAISTKWEADQKARGSNQPVTVTDFRTEIPIRVQQEPQPGKIKATGRFLKGVLETFGILAVMAYTFIAYNQWRQMIVSNDTSRESLQAVQRAFVTFLSVNLDVVPSSLKVSKSDQMQWVFYGIVENSGTTPALEKVQYFTGSNELRDEPSEGDFIGHDANREIGELGPKAQKNIGFLVKNQDFVLGNYPLTAIGTPDFMRFFRSQRIFIWGWVGYRDVFPRTEAHVTEFCEELHGLGVATYQETGKGTKVLRPTVTFMECAKHNCTDKNCKDYQQIADLVPNPK